MTEYHPQTELLHQVLLICFEKFVKGVDQKKKVSTQNPRFNFRAFDNIHEAVVKSEEAKVAFNLMIEVRNKLVDSYKELMRMQV